MNLKSISVLLALACFMLLAPRLAFAQASQAAQDDAFGPSNTLGTQSDSDIWRAIRHGNLLVDESGNPLTDADGNPLAEVLRTLPSISNPNPDAGVMVNAQGTWWMQTRTGDVIQYGSWLLLGMLLLLAVFYVLRGPIRIDGGRSGRVIRRFSLTQRVTHWVMAVVFLLLGFTGLVLLFGRVALIPLIGPKAFSVMATASMQAHNLFGPVFAFMLVIMAVVFIRGNFIHWRDIIWALKGGGFFGIHARTGRYNLGEKAWFWTIVLAGIALTVTGVLMLFPDALADRDQLQKANLVHAIAALGFIAFAFGHIYLATAGTEGTFEGMVDGDVDENWARAHHDIWFEQQTSASESKKT
jgi:formate dehydrogenase subunit gamma